MNNMPSAASQPEYYDNDENRRVIASTALRKGYLRLVLGAGVSSAVGLPGWEQLVTDMAVLTEKQPKGKDLAAKSDWLLRKGASGDRKAFADLVRKALYEGYDGSMPGLSTHPLMVALGALSMAGLRGGVSEIITFNFDNLLELYMRYHGFVVRSTSTLPSLSKRSDVEVLHVHGTLPFSNDEPIPRNIVFTEDDFDEVTGDRGDIWNQRISHILRSNFCLFIGVSGDDPNLRSMIRAIRNEHPIRASQRYWGFRFSSSEDDDRREMFEKNGIYQITIPHNNIPQWLLGVTQLAATRK